MTSEGFSSDKSMGCDAPEYALSNHAEKFVGKGGALKVVNHLSIGQNPSAHFVVFEVFFKYLTIFDQNR